MLLDEQSLETLKLQPVGNGMIDIICSFDNVDAFIDLCNAHEVSIKGFTWWCHVVDGHEPCGMGGPKSIYYDGWFSEVLIDDMIRFSDNESYRKYLKNIWPAEESYRNCYWPAFWLEE